MITVSIPICIRSPCFKYYFLESIYYIYYSSVLIEITTYDTFSSTLVGHLLKENRYLFFTLVFVIPFLIFYGNFHFIFILPPNFTVYFLIQGIH